MKKLKKLKQRRKVLRNAIEEVQSVVPEDDDDYPRWLHDYMQPIQIKALEEELHRVEERIERYKDAIDAAENATSSAGVHAAKLDSI